MIPEFDIVYPNCSIKEKYDIGLVITTFNRPYYLHRTLAKLRKSNLDNTVVLIIDDKSDNPHTLSLLKHFELRDTPIIKAYRKKKEGCRMYEMLQFGWDFLVEKFDCNYLTNLDPDALVLPYWISRLKAVCDIGMKLHGGCLITGFNAYQHTVLEEHELYYVKKTAGGINFFFNQKIYKEIVQQQLLNLAWDFKICESAAHKNYPILCTRPSVVQHIGRAGIWSNPKKAVFDFASDFGDTDPFWMKVRLFYFDKRRIYSQKIYGFVLSIIMKIKRVVYRIVFRKLY